MKVTNLCKKVGRIELLALIRYAKKLDATEFVIWKDGTIDLYEDDNIICERYNPSSKELYN